MSRDLYHLFLGFCLGWFLADELAKIHRRHEDLWQETATRHTTDRLEERVEALEVEHGIVEEEETSPC